MKATPLGVAFLMLDLSLPKPEYLNSKYIRVNLWSLILFIFLGFTTSCISTKHALVEGQKLFIPENSVIIILPVTSKTNVSRTNYSLISNQFDSECIRFFHLDELNYDLRVEGINPEEIKALNPEEMKKLNRWHENVFLMEFSNTLNKKSELEGKRKRGFIDYEEVPNRSSAWYTSLYATDDIHYWQFSTNVRINAMQYKDRNVNIYSSAYFIGLKKAIRYLEKEAMAKCE